MKLQGKGAVYQADKTTNKARCRKWRLYQRADGVAYYKRFTGKLSDANRALILFQNQLSQEESAQESFKEYANKWMHLKNKSTDYSPNYLKKLNYNINTIHKAFDKYKLDEITPNIIQEEIIIMRKNRSGTTMNNLFVLFKQIMESAYNEGLIKKNPANFVKAPKKDTKEKRALNSTEIRNLKTHLETLEFDGRVMAVYFMLYQGLRKGEALGLSYEDVKDGKTKINKSLKEATRKIGDTKSKAGNRTIPQPKELQEKISEWNSIREGIGFNGPAFCCDANGEYLYASNFRRWWEHNFKQFNITPHELRHTNLTVMARKIESVHDLQYYAGWADIKMASTYVHKKEKYLIKAVEEIGF